MIHRSIAHFSFTMFVGLFLLPSPLWGYNYLQWNHTTDVPLVWESGTTIQYWLDPGPLGRLTNEQAHTLLKEAMKIWENASPYADVPHFEFAGYLPEDVTAANYEKYVSAKSCYTSDLESCPSQTQQELKTAIIFDDNGSVPPLTHSGDSILYEHLCPILGCAALASPYVWDTADDGVVTAVQGFATFGVEITGYSIDGVIGVFVHELGHLLGLGHNELNQQLFDETVLSRFDPLPEEDRALIPSMELGSFLRLGGDEKQSVTLNPDDIAGISTLYPSNDFHANTGTITGQILKSDGSFMTHVNVVARNIEDPLCEAYGFLSGRGCGVATSPTCGSDHEPTSAELSYTISGLPPGTYTVEVEEVVSLELTAVMAGMHWSGDHIYGDAEFWNENDAADDPSNLTSSTITLAAGETRDGIDIILNRSEVTDDRIKFIPLSTFTPGPATRCPIDSPVDYAAMIGIDESEDTQGDVIEDSNDSASTGGCSLVNSKDALSSH